MATREDLIKEKETLFSIRERIITAFHETKARGLHDLARKYDLERTVIGDSIARIDLLLSLTNAAETALIKHLDDHHALCDQYMINDKDIPEDIDNLASAFSVVGNIIPQDVYRAAWHKKQH